MYRASTCVTGKSYHRQLRPLSLCWHGVFHVLINSLACGFCTGALGLVPFEIAILHAGII